MEKIAKDEELDASFIECIPTHLYTIAKELPNYIMYQAANMRKWISCFDKGLGFGDVHGTSMLPLYVKGLVERNQYIWSGTDFNSWAAFAKGKKILDVGFGGGFYARKFCELNPDLKVYGVEKRDVADYVMKNIVMPDNFIILNMEEIKNLGPTYDVIFFSEVFHGRSVEQIKTMLGTYRSLLNEKGQIFINELWNETPLGDLFSMNMLIHGKDGRLYTQREMGRIAEDARLIALSHKSTKYHWLIACPKY